MDKAVKSHILQLQEAARQNRLVIFVGAGVSASAGVPAWRELVEMFKNELPENIYDQNDILKSAQVYRELRGEVEYLKQVKNILKYGQASCNQIHKAIMELNPCHIVTTNYDDLLEQSALQNNKQYYVVAKDSHLPANQGERMLVKMHGDFKEGNIVLTENDYYDYSRNFPLIRSFLLSLFSTKVVLFVGFSFDDINLKYILREVSSILQSKMQRVYMLVDDEKSALSYSYFEKKGIQLLSIPFDDSKAILDSQKIEYNNTGLSHIKSIALYQSLKLIKSYDSADTDVILSAVGYLKRYDDQIRFWGKYLKYVFPKNDRQGFEISQYELTLPYGYKEWFDENVKNADVWALKEKYGSKLDWLLDKLQTNRILTVNGKSIYDEARADINEKDREKCALNILHSLSVTDIVNRVKVLKSRPLNYTIEDLELPYILYKVGRYFEAYSIYKQLAPEFWKRRKYILYFISLYNTKALNGKIINSEIGKRDFDFQAFQKEIGGINLYDILDELPLDESIKELLETLVNGNMLMKDWIESARLNEQLYQQRKSAERGGSALNNNIVALLDKFEQTFYFCNENYILNECYKYSQDAYLMMAKGVLNSIMTPDNDEHFQTKLDKLLYRNILLFVFMVDSEELKKILNTTVYKLIPAEDKFINTLGLLIGNLAEDIRNGRGRDYLDQQIVANYVKNIILLLNRIENAPTVIDIYQVILRYWYKGRFIEFCPELQSLCRRQEPTGDEAIKILENALHSPTLQHAKDADDFISCLSYMAKKCGKVLEEIVDAKQLDYIDSVRLRAAFLLALAQPVREELISKIQESVDNIYDLCIIEIHSELHIINADLLEKLKGTFKKDDHIHFWTEEVACSILHDLSQKEGYEDLSETIERLCAENDCLRFISDPLNYDKLPEGSWLVQLPDEELKSLLLKDDLRKMAIRYSEVDSWNVRFRERLWNLLKD